MPRLIKITTLLIKRYFNGLNFNFVTKQTIETINPTTVRSRPGPYHKIENIIYEYIVRGNMGTD